MKNPLQFTLSKTLVGLVIPLIGLNFTTAATAQITAIEAIKQVRCTPSTCTPYRANFERAIANGIISRPSLVADENLAIDLADRALERGDRNEAARRIAQALVIVSEKQNIQNALAIEQTLDAETRTKKGQSLRQFLPLFGRIFPPNQNPYR